MIKVLAEHRGLFYFEVCSMLSLLGAVASYLLYAVEISILLGQYDKSFAAKRL